VFKIEQAERKKGLRRETTIPLNVWIFFLSTSSFFYNMGAHRYPNLQPTIPSSRAKASTTVRLLKPGIMMGTVVILTVASVSGMAVGVGILRGRHAMDVMASQGFIVAAVGLLCITLDSCELILMAVDVRDLICAAPFPRGMLQRAGGDR